MLAYAATRVARAQLPSHSSGRSRPWRGSQRSASPTGECAALLLAMHFDAWWREPWLNNALRTIDQATRPFQFAMQSRAGTDALVLSVRAALDTRENAVIVLLRWSQCIRQHLTRVVPGQVTGGRATVVAVRAAFFMDKRLPIAGGMLPATCGRYAKVKAASRAILWPRRFLRWDNTSPLARAAETLHPSDSLMAFLDDLYLVTVLDHCRGFLDVVTLLPIWAKLARSHALRRRGSPNWSLTCGVGTSRQTKEAWSCSVCWWGIPIS